MLPDSMHGYVGAANKESPTAHEKGGQQSDISSVLEIQIEVSGLGTTIRFAGLMWSLNSYFTFLMLRLLLFKAKDCKNV